MLFSRARFAWSRALYNRFGLYSRFFWGHAVRDPHSQHDLRRTMSCWLRGSRQGDPAHDLTRLSDAQLWGTLASECVCSVYSDLLAHSWRPEQRDQRCGVGQRNTILYFRCFNVFFDLCSHKGWCDNRSFHIKHHLGHHPIGRRCNKSLLGENINNDSFKNLLLMCCFRCPQSHFTVRI